MKHPDKKYTYRIVEVEGKYYIQRLTKRFFFGYKVEYYDTKRKRIYDGVFDFKNMYFEHYCSLDELCDALKQMKYVKMLDVRAYEAAIHAKRPIKINVVAKENTHDK